MAEETTQGTTEQTTGSTVLADATTQKTETTGTQTGTQGTTETVLTQPVSLVKPDGTFIEGWQNKLPDDIKAEECLKLVPNFNEMVKQFVNQRKAIGKNKVALPNEKSDEKEWDAFYTAIGRPKSSDDYTTPETPKELGDIYNDNAMKAAKEFAFKIGATQKQFNEYVAFDVAQKSALLAEQDELELKEIRQQHDDTDKLLRKEWGMAYDDYIHASKRFLTESTDKESERLEVTAKYGNDPLLIKIFAKGGLRLQEHTALIGELTHKVPAEIQGRINEIQGNKDYANRNSSMSPEERQHLTDELSQLYKQLYPAKKTG